jgi:hypothetical protein
MSDRKPAPFTTEAVLRGLELAVGLVEMVARETRGTPRGLSGFQESDLERARAWLDEAKRKRHGG